MFYQNWEKSIDDYEEGRTIKEFNTKGSVSIK